MTLRVELLNGVAEKIYFETNKTGSLSLASSWYLNTFFRFSGINAEMIDNSFADPSKIYLCYNSKDATFGVGHAKGYDLIFSQSNIGNDLMPSFCYRELKRRQYKTNYFYYDDDKQIEHKISFFVPSDEPATVDFKPYIDINKLKAICKIDIKARHFVEQMSLKEIGVVNLNKDTLLDNIGRSILYHVCHNHTDSNKYYTGEIKEVSRYWKLSYLGKN